MIFVEAASAELVLRKLELDEETAVLADFFRLFRDAERGLTVRVAVISIVEVLVPRFELLVHEEVSAARDKE